MRRHTSLLHFPPNQQACTNRSFVCQTLAWLREPACSGVGLTIDITVLPHELSVCFLHGSLSLSPSILELTVRLVARLISHSLRGMFGLWSAKQTRAFKSTQSLIDNGCAFGPRKASKVEKPSSRGVSSLHRWSLMLLPVLWPMPLCALCTHMCVYRLL